MSAETETPDFDLVDIPKETPEDDPHTTWIAHRYNEADGTPVEKRMPMSEWPAYAKENGL